MAIAFFPRDLTRTVLCLAMSAAASPTTACEPVWVRPIDLAAQVRAFEGRVERVDWFGGKVTVAPQRQLAGKQSGNIVVKFENIPFTCGWQFFSIGRLSGISCVGRA